MSISDELRDECLEFKCPRCSHVMVKKGSWFKVISNFNCDQCEARIRLGYPAKVALFEEKRQSLLRLRAEKSERPDQVGWVDHRV
jgi:transposase-like protein